MVFLHWDFTLQKNDKMSFTKNMKKNNKTCILICRTDSETKNWVNGSQVIVVSIGKNHATSPYTVKHQTYTSYSTANMLKKDTRQGNVISITPVSVENLKAKNNIFVNNS